jgi:uncharacterized protein
MSTKAKLAEEYANNHQLISFAGYDSIPMVNIHSNFASAVGRILGKTNPFGLTYWVNNGKVIASLRSREDGVNVRKVAEQYGGGGHDHAASIVLSIEQLVPLVNGCL